MWKEAEFNLNKEPKIYGLLFIVYCFSFLDFEKIGDSQRIQGLDNAKNNIGFIQSVGRVEKEKKRLKHN